MGVFGISWKEIGFAGVVTAIVEELKEQVKKHTKVIIEEGVKKGGETLQKELEENHREKLYHFLERVLADADPEAAQNILDWLQRVPHENKAVELLSRLYLMILRIGGPDGEELLRKIGHLKLGNFDPETELLEVFKQIGHMTDAERDRILEFLDHNVVQQYLQMTWRGIRQAPAVLQQADVRVAGVLGHLNNFLDQRGIR